MTTFVDRVTLFATAGNGGQQEMVETAASRSSAKNLNHWVVLMVAMVVAVETSFWLLIQVSQRF